MKKKVLALILCIAMVFAIPLVAHARYQYIRSCGFSATKTTITATITSYQKQDLSIDIYVYQGNTLKWSKSGSGNNTVYNLTCSTSFQTGVEYYVICYFDANGEEEYVDGYIKY